MAKAFLRDRQVYRLASAAKAYLSSLCRPVVAMVLLPMDKCRGVGVQEQAQQRYHGKQGSPDVSLCCSVEPILEASGVKHQMHLSIETLDAPASAIADVITKVADQVAAELVVLGANRKSVRSRPLVWCIIAITLY